MKFEDIEFFPVEGPAGGIQALVFHTNGYGISIINNIYSYGSEEGLYELAIIKGTKEKWHLCYDTPITADVIGHLTKKDVEKILDEVDKLVPALPSPS